MVFVGCECICGILPLCIPSTNYQLLNTQYPGIEFWIQVWMLSFVRKCNLIVLTVIIIIIVAVVIATLNRHIVDAFVRLILPFSFIFPISSWFGTHYLALFYLDFVSSSLLFQKCVWINSPQNFTSLQYIFRLLWH